MAGKDNLKSLADRTTEEQRKIAIEGGKASGKARRKKKFMSEIYANFLMKEHDIVLEDGTKKKISGEKLLDTVMEKVVTRGDSASVRMMKEMREATEGSKMTLDSRDYTEQLEKIKELTEKHIKRINDK